MYRLVYNLFLKWGHAIKLPEPQWQDMEGKEVVEAMATGCKVEYKLLYPNRILTMDETGDNGNQSVDKINRANKVLCEANGTKPTHAASCTDTQWTTQAYTTLGGEAVLFVIIIKKKSILDFNEHYGYEIDAEWIGGGEDACIKGELPTQEQMKRNMGGVERRFPGAISCVFNGITIPSLMFASRGGGVTEDILVAALEHLDKLNVFPREEGVPNPSLLVDGHGSRIQPKFVQYINNLKEDWTEDDTANHRWDVALGLPNSTHHWQVADSSELNQTFKAACRQAKDALRNQQIANCKTPQIKRFHVVPICNYAFVRSFQKKANVKKAVAMRGWHPMNMNCLTAVEVQRTKVIDEATYNRGNPPTPAELAVMEQSPQVIEKFNWTGNITKQLFDLCGQTANRFKAQDEAVKVRRAKQKKLQDSGALITMMGRMTSGKMYDNGIASVNDPNLINFLRTKKESVDKDLFRKECKKYIAEKTKWDKGERTMSEFLDKKEKKPGSWTLNHKELQDLLRWKWMAAPPHERPKASVLTKTGEEGKKLKMDLWAEWEQRKDPLPPFIYQKILSCLKMVST